MQLSLLNVLLHLLNYILCNQIASAPHTLDSVVCGETVGTSASTSTTYLLR